MNYLLDLHVHTSASLDGLSSLEEQAAAARAAGLDAIAVTDHNLCTPVPETLEGVLLIPGCELSTLHGHITGLFLQAPLELDTLRRDGLPSGGAAVEEIRKKGGVAVLAHPFQSPSARPEEFDFRPDCVEGANARAALKVKDANQRAAALAMSWGLPAVGGSDAHSRYEVGNARTWVQAEECTLPALREAILAGRCGPVLQKNTPHLRKGFSQLAQARRRGGVKNLAVGCAYTAYCGVLDLLGR